MKTVGILGGGQLGSLLSESVFRLGAKVAFYDPSPASPAFFRSSLSIQGSWTDREKLERFFSLCDVVTYEFENVSTDLLATVSQTAGVPLFPSAEVLAITQNRAREKQFSRQNGFPVCNFAVVRDFNELSLVSKQIPFPFVVKTVSGGYDGKGQWTFTCQQELESFLTEQKNHQAGEFVVEEKLAIATEISCIVARNALGHVISFPVFENLHHDHILSYTLVPARISPCVAERVQDIAVRAAERLGVVGLLTTEFFLTKTQSQTQGFSASVSERIEDTLIFVNEFAPRPHNSGHVTRNSCTMSQFDAHARVLLDLPLHPPRLLQGAFCMGNLLGDIWLAQNRAGDPDLSSWRQIPDVVDVVLYGKQDPQAKRKMGHFVTFSSAPEASLVAAKNFRETLKNNR